MRLPAGITRNVIVLGVVSFLTDISSEMLYPLVPLFLTTQLGAAPTIVGLIEGIAESVASLLKIWSGSLSDRMGVRKPLIFAGYGLSAATRPLLSIAQGWGLVLAARVLDRFGKGLRTAARDALIADSVPPEHRGRAFGLHRSMDQFGAVVGPLIGLAVLSASANDYRLVFLIAFIPSALSTMAVAFASERRGEPSHAKVRIAWGELTPALRRFLLVLGVFSIGNSADAFLILRAQNIGAAPNEAIGMFAAFNLVYVLASIPAGVLSDRIGRGRVFGAGLIVFAAVYAGFGIVSQKWHLWILFPAYGLFMGMTDGVSRALVAGLAPPGRRATALGAVATVTGLAALPASLLAGWLWTTAGPHMPFLFGGAMALLAAIVFWAVSNVRSSG